jgi:hypothetical protein
MQISTIKSKLLANGWEKENIDNLPNYSLYTDVECIFSFQNRVTLQYHPNQNFLRLIISGVRETVTANNKGYTKRAAMHDSVGLQLSFGNNPEKIIDSIIEKQEELKIKNYIFLSSHFNEICDCSILALEQFLDKEDYLLSLEQQDPENIAAATILEQTTLMCKKGQFKKAQSKLVAYLKNGGKMNVQLYYNLFHTSTSPGMERLSKENSEDVIKSAKAFLDSLEEISDEYDMYLFFIIQATILMIKAEQYLECVTSIQKYLDLGGYIHSDLLLNYSHSAGLINDIDLQKKVLDEMIFSFNNQPELFSKEDTNYWYTADNIACLAAAVKDKDNMLKHLEIAKKLDPNFKDNKMYKAFKYYWEDPDFLALFN